MLRIRNLKRRGERERGGEGLLVKERERQRKSKEKKVGKGGQRKIKPVKNR